MYYLFNMEGFLQCEMVSCFKVIVKQSDVVLYFFNVQIYDGFIRIYENLDINGVIFEEGYFSIVVNVGIVVWDVIGY